MAKLEIKYQELIKALESLDRAIELFKRASVKREQMLLRSLDEDLAELYGYDEIIKSFRDSLIQRFEYSVDSFWKQIKDYLEIVLGEQLEMKGPKHIVRAAGKDGILSEEEVTQALEMLNHRNLTSHMYREEIAQEISAIIDRYHQLMVRVTQKIKP
ncbi:nucleotidyltransferase substrate binding protein [Candidatus Dependentiae bacterium]|nr:nucleotidyltransferase substrate binding protein [Candidatus Dependentiae bacterium]